MALPELTLIRAVNPTLPPLFARLPDTLFKPLASLNHERYWSILARLHRNRFGPDAPLPPSDGFPIRDIISDIERELDDSDAWEVEDGCAPAANLNAHANMIFNRLVDTEWLRRGRHGAEKVVTMSPAISHFLNLLMQFAESGPIYVSGKINSIFGLITMVESEEASGDTLIEAAQQARNLLEHIRNTSTIIRDLMESLSKEPTPSKYLSKFFSDYIERVFIGDYRELRTREHPLSKRQQILRTVEGIDESQSERARLIQWYEQKQFPGDIARAERQYERDLHRLRELARIDEYLDRLDDEIRRANRRALAYLDYSVRTVRPIGQLINAAIASINSGTLLLMSDPFAAGGMINGMNLAMPRKLTKRLPPSKLRKALPAPEDIARAHLMQRARDARAMTPPKLTAFLLRQLDEKYQVGSAELEINAVPDGRAYQTLATVSVAMGTQSPALQKDVRSMVPGFHVIPQSVSEEAHAFISGKSFLVSRKNINKEIES
ncbi:Wadjet anti-phage system protein JetA family protein [Duganella radicis]|uniref:Uncharacterized protein n=1 Tax=Duganella radicis TaxID=551988 RepID=A0A6L6PTV0_9BURK|nr:Wadjet anti-phage system protein JetA family protein [Duganella radicis]MTV41675.1 hypothetical protein [Duganella radicis]